MFDWLKKLWGAKGEQDVFADVELPPEDEPAPMPDVPEEEALPSVEVPEESEEFARELPELPDFEPEFVEPELPQFPPLEVPEIDYTPEFPDPPNLFTGRGLSSQADRAITGPPEPDESREIPEETFWAQITGWEVVDTPAQNRWTYSWKGIYKATAGYDGWSDLDTTGSNNAFNTIENMNTAADATSPTVQGNGVDIDGADFPAGFEIQPAPIHVIVAMTPVQVGETLEYWFTYENGIDGTCEAPA